MVDSRATGGCSAPSSSTAAAVIIRAVPPTGFASAAELSEEELRAAPVRYPRVSALARPLRLPGQKAEQAAEALGLQTVGDLLEHLPRDQRDARTLAEVMPGDSATVVVQVRSIASRSVRRRGMKPLVEAVVADASDQIKVAFFNQPWLVSRYAPGTRLLLHLRRDERGRYSVTTHAPTSEATSEAGA